MNASVIDSDTGEVLVESEQDGGLVMRADGFEFTPTGLVVKGEPSFDVWQAVGQRLQQIEAAVQWWIGDWLNYGEAHWGETFAQAVEETAYTSGSLANMKWVAGRVDPDTRHEGLSYSHHVAVAPLPHDEQGAWLDKAESEGLNVQQLRNAIRRPQLAPPNSNGRMLGQIDHASLTVTLWPRTQEDIGAITDRMDGLVEWR